MAIFPMFIEWCLGFMWKGYHLAGVREFHFLATGTQPIIELTQGVGDLASISMQITVGSRRHTLIGHIGIPTTIMTLHLLLTQSQEM